MQKLFRFCSVAILGIAITASPALAELTMFGYAKVKPTYYSNFDLDDDASDPATLNEGGFVSGAHMRTEVRLGWKASGEKWSIMAQAEVDQTMNKDNVDRSFYTGAEKEGVPNRGSEFGIERAEFTYTFLPQLKLATGWNIRFLDIKTGGLLYGDDHPFLELSGVLTDALNYQLLYIPIQNLTSPFSGALPTTNNDWRVYSAKLNFNVPNAGTLSPFFAFSDNRGADGGTAEANIYYYGLEGLGSFGIIKPSFEVILSDGEFNDDRDISSMAAYAAVEVAMSKAFNPYIAGRYTQGDDGAGDNDVEGFVGITDIGRFTGLMGMDGNILGEHLGGGNPYNAPLYSYSPDRAGGGSTYGGISNASSGNNPGQQLLAIGAKGDLSQFIPKLLYKTQAFFIKYDDTANLTNVKNPGESVDDYAGTTFDLQLTYAFDDNFSMDYIYSALLPGDGLEDQAGSDDMATVNMLTMAWKY